MAFIGDQLEEMARQHPSAAALKSAATEFSWGGFVDAVHQIEAALADRTHPGGRVALLLSDPSATLLSFFACARSGRIAMVMDHEWPAVRIQNLLAATDPALILDDSRYQRLMQQKDAEHQCNSNDPSSKRVFPDETDAFYAGFTSGSTGLPKGFVRSHRSWLESFCLSEVDFKVAEPSRIITAGGLSHSLHLYGAVHSLHRGTPVTVVPRFDPRTVLDALREGRGQAALYATPTQLQLIADAASRLSTPVDVAHVFSSGAKWPDAARSSFENAFPTARLVEFYGASETSFISFSRSGDGTPPGSVGKPANRVKVVVGDPEKSAPCGTAGPLWVKSDLLFSHYICGDAPEAEWKGEWLTFGDRGFLDENDYLFLTGRENRMVITSGLNVYPEEVEAALMAHPAVRAAVVLGLDDPLRGQRLEAIVELKGALENPERHLGQHCRALLGAGKTPKTFHICAKMPLTAGGKPDIQALLHDLKIDLKKDTHQQSSGASR